MKNNKLTKLEKIASQIVDRDEYMRQSIFNSFYNNGSIANFTHSSEEDPLAPLLEMAKAEPAPNTLTQEQMGDICLQIRENVKQGKQGNIEIQFHKGLQISDKHARPLGNTIVKITPMDTSASKYFFIKTGDILNTTIFLGGDNVSGIMVIEDENGDEHLLRLSELQMLSLQPEPDPRKEIGLMTSYLWLTNVYTNIILGFDLNPVKNLLLAEWLQKEWQLAKDNASHSSNLVIGGDVNE